LEGKNVKSLLENSQLLTALTPMLFTSEEMQQEFIGDPAAQGHYSAERLFSSRPEIYREIVDQLAQGCSRRSIKFRCKVHHYTIDAVEERESSTIDTLKKAFSRKCYQGGNRILESLLDDVDQNRLKPEAKAFALTTLVNTGQLLSGGATARVEKIEKVSIDLQLREALDDLPLIDAEIVEIDPQINLAPGNESALSLPDLGSSHEQSDVSEASYSVESSIASGSASGLTDPLPTEEGGRGLDPTLTSENGDSLVS